ncbi:AraC family transcriptional regulator [Chitinophaga rhizosphaerae]|uniref:AraC family transcriptional regulator n=1 Tax=Chitinophaga rhizosphaerae TaxID=1864947 RepID=UPI0013E02E5E|nr:AraC family transcriptional regulator [Chitinophaga rhizosphaerae]
MKTLEMKRYTTFKSHVHFEIALIENCRGKRLIGDSIEPFDTPELVLLGSYLPHCWQYQEVKDPADEPRVYVIHFMPDFLGSEMLEIPEMKPLKELFSLAARGVLFTGDTVGKARVFIRQMLTDNDFNRIVTFLQLLHLLTITSNYQVLSSPYYNSKETFADGHKIREVLNYVYSNFRNEISLQEVAALVHMSTTGFCRFFKQKTNKTLTDVIQEVRIGYAGKLLLEGAHNVSGACYECGYNNLSNFNKHFRDIKGCSPTEFLKKFQDKADAYAK